MLNGQEWVERQARKQTIATQKADNCFVGGSFQALEQLADTLRDEHAIGRVAKVCDRWVYTSCLCFALDTQEQQRSQFRYQYSAYQLELSRNLVFTRGTDLDVVYHGMIDRTREHLDIPKLRTIVGYQHRPKRRLDKLLPRQMQVLDQSAYTLTVFKLHFGPFTLKVYDKGACVLRIEAVVHHSFLPQPDVLDTLATPSKCGNCRVAGIDLQKSRIRQVSEAILSLAPSPDGFSVLELAEKVQCLGGIPGLTDTTRHASYDLTKFRGKRMVKRVERSRRYCAELDGIRTLAGLLTLREKVIKPVLAGTGKSRPGRPPKNIQAIDRYYINLQYEMQRTFETLALAA